MTKLPPFGSWLRLGVPLVALLAYLLSGRVSDAAREADVLRGDGFSIVRGEGAAAIPRFDGDGAILAHGDSFRLADEESSEHRVQKLRFVLERLGESGFADLRFRMLPNVAHELKIARATSFGVALLHVPRDAPRSRLAAAQGADPLPRMLTPFEFVLEFADGRIVASVNGTRVFECADDHEQDGAIALFARQEPLRIHSVTVDGTRRGEPYRLDVDFKGLRGASPWNAVLRRLGIALLAFWLLAIWLHAMCGDRRSFASCARVTALPGSIPLAVLAIVAGLRGTPIETNVWVFCWLACAILARIALRREAMLSASPARGIRVLRLVIVLAVFTVIGFAGAKRELALLEPVRAHHRAANSEPRPAPYSQPEATTLDAGNSILVDGPFRDFDLRARLTLAPDSVLEARLHGQRSDGIVFIASTSSTTETRFVRATPMEFSTIGTRVGRIPESSPVELSIEARGNSYVARLDGRELVSATERLYPSGSIACLAVRGRVVVHGLELTPVDSAPSDDGANRDAAIGATIPIVGLLALALFAAMLLKRSPLDVALSAGIASLPFSFALEELGRGAAAGATAIALPLFFFVGLALDHLQRAKETTPFRLNVALIGAIIAAALQHGALTRREWPPNEKELNALTCLDFDDAGPLAPELLHFEHPLFRRWNFYLADHRFRKRTFATARTPGRARVLALGTSSTYGYGANEDWPTILEQELRSPAFGSRSVEVINAGTPGSTSWRLLYFLEHSLLRFDPDVLVISFYYNDSVALTQFDERSEIERITNDGPSLLRDLMVSRMLDTGGRRFLALDVDFRAREFDAMKEWSVAGLSPPPERFHAVIRDYAELCRERGISLVLLQEPISGDRRRIWKDEFRAVFSSIGAEYGAPVVDPSAAQVAAGAEKLFMDEVHPYVEGHRITARLLAPVVAGVLDAKKR